MIQTGTMRQKRISAANYEYVAVEWGGVNESGFIALADHIIVLCDVAPEKSAGGIFISDDKQWQQQMMAETGVIVEIGNGAFMWLSDRTRPWEGRKPVVGERIVFERYAGRLQTGADGREYRIMSDRCVAAIMGEPPPGVREAAAERELQKIKERSEAVA